MEKYEEILALLGGFNCGGCGYADCEECAKAIANGEVEATSCLPIEEGNLEQIKKILEKK